MQAHAHQSGAAHRVIPGPLPSLAKYVLCSAPSANCCASVILVSITSNAYVMQCAPICSGVCGTWPNQLLGRTAAVNAAWQAFKASSIQVPIFACFSACLQTQFSYLPAICPSARLIWVMRNMELLYDVRCQKGFFSLTCFAGMPGSEKTRNQFHCALLSGGTA